MIQTLARNWMLLLLCGILEASASVICFIMWSTGGPITFHSWNGTVVLLGKLAIASGLCATAAGIWRASSGRCWPLAVHGAALAALGVILYGLTGFRISLLAIALLIAVMAAAIGILGIVLPSALRRQGSGANRWTFSLAGAACGGFALMLLALGCGWIKTAPGSYLELLGLGAFFAFSAALLIAMALRSRPDNTGREAGIKKPASTPPAGFAPELSN